MTRYSIAVLVFAAIFVVIGVALLVRTTAAGGGVIGYVLGAPSTRFTETLFVLGRPSGMRITGGRLGLTGP